MFDDPIVGWGLRPVEMADRGLFDACFASLSQPISDYTFSQLFTWRNSLRILWKRLDGHLCVFANGTGDLTLLLPPVGDTGGDRALASAFELMDDYNAAHAVPDRSRVEYVSDELLRRFDRTHFDVRPMGFDYLYDVERMIDLAGGDLASKRQAKNRFVRNYAHYVEPYDPARHLAGCRRLLEQWRGHQDTQHAGNPETAVARAKRLKEYAATELCLESAGALGIKGMVVYVRDPAAGAPMHLRGFTFGEPLGADQSSITIEKTDLGVKGLAQFIFSEFCRTAWADRPLVNVGDDWGLETLAWTKRSYRPVKLLNKYEIRPMRAVAIAAPQKHHSPEAAAPEAAPVDAAQSLRVRAARSEDLAAAMQLEASCFGAEVRLKARQIRYLHRRGSAVFLVAEHGGPVVGTAIGLLRRHKAGVTGRLYSLAVHSESRGRKVGRTLLDAMLRELASRGAGRVYLEVEQDNAGAVRLYESAGFRRVRPLRGYYGKGRDGWHMVQEAREPHRTAG
jgi:ribosomal protein S18 acetylase RimI-like enzyme